VKSAYDRDAARLLQELEYVENSLNERSRRRGYKVIITQYWLRMKGGLIVTSPTSSLASQDHTTAASEASQGDKKKDKD
jgi:hypothetical protein